jgi:putative protease
MPLKIELPLVGAEAETGASWQGFAPLGPIAGFGDVADSPEPEAPQGAYSLGDALMPIGLPALDGSRHGEPAELLAPAGGPEAAYAAFHFGADAIYLGLKKFSARAEAENFTLDELDEITAYAHSLTPRRRVFVAVNTVIRQDELPELVEAIASLDDIGVDAVILQDLGVYHLIHRHFPNLDLHASTQLAVHNRAGAEALRDLGFSRVVLARELTFEEVHDITQSAGIETEVFIHGALCYSYSGLCLFSAQTLGRSGNRGKCAYSCRDAFDVTGAPLELKDGTPVKRDPRAGFPFSMKDLALPDHLPALQAAGVSCFKIEGRKKSPLYVATTTDFYRKLLDGHLEVKDRPEHEAQMQTVFSRPWTQLFVHSHKDKEVADRDTVGHRGTLIGRVEAVGGQEPKLRFKAARPLERHDGLQVDLPTLGKPFGFAVDHLWVVEPGNKNRGREVFEALAGQVVEVNLPRDHPPLPIGAPVYCSSSQAVKQQYRFDKPKPGLHRTRRDVDVEVELSAAEMVAIGRIGGEPAIECRSTVDGPFAQAHDAVAMEAAARSAFEKLGQTGLKLRQLSFRNPAGLFVPVSRLNHLRRDLTAALETAAKRRLEDRIASVGTIACSPASGNEVEPATTSKEPTKPRWSIMVDTIGFLAALEDGDLFEMDEIVVDIARDHPTLLVENLDRLADRVGRNVIRLALPALTRRWEDKGLRHKIEQLRGRGWTKWQAANLSAWKFLDDPRRLDIATDWSVYVVNRLAALELLQWGVSRFTLSPEDGLANMGTLVAEFGPRATVIVHQDTPLFVAESCAYSNLIGGCPGKANCNFESMEMVSSHGEKVLALDYHCRTIVLNQGPFCLSHRLGDLVRAGAVSFRADFIYRKYQPAEVAQRWRQLRAGQRVPGGHAAHFDGGLL